MRRASALLGLCICLCTALMSGCNWFSGDPQLGESPAGEEPEATEHTFSFAAQSGEGAANGDHTSVNTRRNPQRVLGDPYYIIGQPAREWDVSQWANLDYLKMDEPITLEKLRGKVVVVHFWEDANDGSRRTLQALNQLAEEFHSEPVVFVGIFLTRNSIADEPWSVAKSLTNDWEVTIPIAADESTHVTWWRSRYDHLPSTPTFVIDPDGEISHLHPGPELFPSDEVADRICNEDYHALRRAIHSALGQQLAETTSES